MGEEHALPAGSGRQEQKHIAIRQAAGKFQSQHIDVAASYRANSRTDSRGALGVVRTNAVQKTTVAGAYRKRTRRPKPIERLDDPIGVHHRYPTAPRLQASRLALD
jgi:hypothetical protein